MTAEAIPADPRYIGRLGRTIRNHDPQNRLFRALDRPPAPVPGHIPGASWYRVDIWDQGQTSSCTTHAAVGVCRTAPNLQHGWTGKGSAWPFYDTPGERFVLYQFSKTVDPWDGVDYDGTSTDAPYRVLRDRGQIPGWRWLFGVDEVKEWLINYGPLSVGTDWHESMFDPDSKGFLTVSGPMVGGHAYEIVAYNKAKNAFRVVNSWGRNWGQGGRAWLRYNDLDALLKAGGDAVTVG